MPPSQHVKAFKPSPNYETIIQDIFKALEIVVAADFPPRIKKIFLTELVWKYTEAHGKYNLPYRSKGALLLTNKKKFQHEHVVPKSALVARMLASPEQASAILREAVACVVTKEEHDLLRGAKDLHGWALYQHVGLNVFQSTDEGWTLLDLNTVL